MASRRYQNHVIDPTYFYDAIEEFSFNYDIYINIGKTINERGMYVNEYSKEMIRGSLQSGGTRLQQSKSGTTMTMSYSFYCKSLYRINIGDIIEYKDKYLLVDSIHDYDEYGVRSCELSMIQLTAYADLAAYIKYLRGEELI